MKESDRYLKVVEWSEEDQKYIGTCPELFDGGCHGVNEAKVCKELCEIVDEWIEIYKKHGDPLPEPKHLIECSGKFIVRVGILRAQAACLPQTQPRRTVSKKAAKSRPVSLAKA